MKGVRQAATIIITLEGDEKLEAPPNDQGQRHYLPCDDCSTIEAVQWHVVAFVCNRCAAKRHGFDIVEFDTKAELDAYLKENWRALRYISHSTAELNGKWRIVF